MKASRIALALLAVILFTSLSSAGEVTTSCGDGEQKVLQLPKSQDSHVFDPSISKKYSLCMDSNFNAEIKKDHERPEGYTPGLDITRFYSNPDRGAHVGKPGEYRGSGEAWAGNASHALFLEYGKKPWYIYDVSENCGGLECRFLLSLAKDANSHAGKEGWENDLFVRLNQPPEVFVSFTEDSEGQYQAEVICNDQTPSCDSNSYRLKKWADASNAPTKCPEDYSSYNIKSKTAELESENQYFCATAKDGVGKEGFSARPRSPGSGVLETGIFYSDNYVKISKDDRTYAFHRVENTGSTPVEVNVSLEGVNSTFANERRKYVSFYLPAGDVVRNEIEINPAEAGTTELVAITENLNSGVSKQDKLAVRVTESKPVGQPNDIPGISPVHLIFLLLAGSAVYFSFSKI